MRNHARLLELVLIVLAIGIVGVAWLQVVLNAQLAQVGTPQLWEQVKWLGTLPVMALVGHVVIRRFCPQADPVFLPIGVLLNGLGLVMVRRLDLATAGNSPVLGDRHIFYTLLGLAAFSLIVALLHDVRVLDRYRYLIGIGAIVLLVLPLAPVIGTDLGRGSRIWISLGFMTLQPGEFAKIGLAVFFASFLSEKRALLATPVARFGPIGLPPLRALLPIAAAWGMSLLVLVYQRDLGLSLLLFGLFVSLLYMATGKPHWVILGAVLFTGGAYVAWKLFSHVQVRVDIWLDPFADPYGRGWQLVQSLFALASGGLVGTGWGDGSPGWISDAATDIIFSAIGEETGLVGTLGLLMLYLILIMRGFSTALRARDDFSRLLAAGLAFVVGLQVFVIVGGVTKLIPLTGITLPFVSYGGSSLMANYVILGLLVAMSAERATKVRSTAGKTRTFFALGKQVSE